MSPVLLLNMSVVVFFVGTASSKLNASLIAIAQEMIVDKLYSFA
jgi:hypothetical protein